MLAILLFYDQMTLFPVSFLVQPTQFVPNMNGENLFLTQTQLQCDQMRRFCAISAIFDFDRREKFWSKRGALTLKIRRFSCLVGCFGTAY